MYIYHSYLVTFVLFPSKIGLKLGGSVKENNTRFAKILDITLENTLEVFTRHIKGFRNKRNVKSRTKKYSSIRMKIEKRDYLLITSEPQSRARCLGEGKTSAEQGCGGEDPRGAPTVHMYKCER